MVGVDYSSLILTVEVGWFLLQRVGGRLALIIHCESKRWRCTLFQLTDFCRTMLSISAAYAVYAVFICLSVCPSVTFMDSVETNKDSFNFFSPSGSHTIFSTPNVMAVFRPDPFTGGVECRWDRQYRLLWIERFDCQVQYTQLRRTMANWWH